MNIVKLEAENIKRLRAVTITPEGNLVVVGGNNGQGKSSTLDAIAYALGGKDAICEEPLRRGEKKGKVICDLGDIIVTRTFSSTQGTQLVVTDKGGTKQTSPQKILDALVGAIAFDPLEFASMAPAKQRDILKELVGIDFTKVDANRQRAYDSRTEANREVKRLQALIDSAPDPPLDTPDKEVSVAVLMEELDRRTEHNNALAVAYRESEDAITARDRITDSIAELEEQLTEARAILTQRQTRVKETKEAFRGKQPEDESTIRTQIAAADQINSNVRVKRAHTDLDLDLKRVAGEADNLTAAIQACDEEKQKALAAAKFPTPGLSFGENGVLYNDLPFDQASGAERLRVSVAMGVAMNPTLKVLLVRDGSLLDDANLAMIAKMAEEAEAQVWLERVGKGSECSVIIEDGAVAEKG